MGLCLDLNYNFRTEGVLRVAKLLERFDMQWLEYDNWDPQALLQIKQSTSTRLASCESLVTTKQYRPFLELHAVDVAIIDVPWNGFSQAVQIGRMAECYEINIAPHNYYSHLADLHSLHLCAVLPNVRIMEIDIDDVPWKAELVTRPPQIRDGHIWLSDAPGWGADINEDVLRAHPWPGRTPTRRPDVLRHGRRADGQQGPVLRRDLHLVGELRVRAELELVGVLQVALLLEGREQGLARDLGSSSAWPCLPGMVDRSVCSRAGAGLVPVLELFPQQLLRRGVQAAVVADLVDVDSASRARVLAASGASCSA